jgi:hypothetical protein
MLAEALAASAGSGVLAARGIDIQLSAGDFALLIVGGAAAAGLWAAIGVGLGALVRDQTTTLVGICAWMLIVETLLPGNVPAVAKFAPAAAAAALAGATAPQHPTDLLTPTLGALVLAVYAAALTAAGSAAVTRRDIT